MKLELSFKENNQKLDMGFGQFQNVTDGGFERGYEQGFVEGKQIGFDNAVSKLTEIEITENGRYTPENDNIGFSAVDVNIEGTEEIENLIDESRVLDTEGTVTEKVEQLIDDTAMYKGVMQYLSFDYPTNLTDRFRQYKGTKLPKFDFANKVNVTRCFYGCINVENIDWYINTDVCTIGLSFLSGMSKLKNMVGVNTASMVNASALFMDDVLLETIDEPLNFQSVTNNSNAFSKCYKLKNIQFVKETIKLSLSFAWSNLLSAGSVQSIIDGLATVTTAQTLTLNSAIALTDEQKATIQTKGWTLVQ
jgi:hypothetical protein